MNKKIITTLIIITFIITGLSITTAVDDDNIPITTEIAQSTSEDNDNPIDPIDRINDEEKEIADETPTSTDNNNEENPEEKDDFNTIDEDTTIEEYNTPLSFMRLATELELYRFTGEAINLFVETLENIQNEKYDNLITILKEEEYNSSKILDEFENYNYTEMSELEKLVHDFIGENQENITVYNDNPIINISTNPYIGNIPIDEPDIVISPNPAFIDDKNIDDKNPSEDIVIRKNSHDTPYNNILTRSSHNKANHQYVTHQYSLYDLYHDLLEKYLAGEITFEQLKDSLEDAGYDTSSLTLNDDGSITFMGETSDVPQKVKKENNETANNTVSI